MRGNRPAGVVHGAGAGSIPAHAGEPGPGPSPPQSPRVYPRACGGTKQPLHVVGPVWGLSPRMRGNPGRSSRTVRRRGSIPAHAGEPGVRQVSGAQLRVYPRACGGTMSNSRLSYRNTGLSPRMRGNPSASWGPTARGRSIPAHAEEPVLGLPEARESKVYPRACGGTTGLFGDIDWLGGLSPRMRGNQDGAMLDKALEGSIPAHAEEPACSVCCRDLSRLYPRACGGTIEAEGKRAVRKGLSPRMRGNRLGAPTGCPHRGSIPAHAGEPYRRTPWRKGTRVYPRACGGTFLFSSLGCSVRGLSPRMRGNQTLELRKEVGRRSIPAHAGEPKRRPRMPQKPRVYPRACGGTGLGAVTQDAGAGLSPRMRGNQRAPAATCDRKGSIPAHAGEPLPNSMTAPMSRVYPRACGGTLEGSASRSAGRDLSPRMRGNHLRAADKSGVPGSIPAHAGEPRLI